tara:strand:+ start:769 stop:960 length:192 start_codon:yes stop_codon:yes gene_type:complete
MDITLYNGKPIKIHRNQDQDQKEIILDKGKIIKSIGVYSLFPKDYFIIPKVISWLCNNRSSLK